jgi:hypothetical protein
VLRAVRVTALLAAGGQRGGGAGLADHRTPAAAPLLAPQGLGGLRDGGQQSGGGGGGET